MVFGCFDVFEIYTFRLHVYYMTYSQTEIDLVPEGPEQQVWAIEVKRSVAPKVSKGFYSACEDIKATHGFVIYSGSERYKMAEHAEAIGLKEFLYLF